jgi:hypothetical protein
MIRKMNSKDETESCENKKTKLSEEIKMKIVNGFLVPESCTEEKLKLATINVHPRDQDIIFDEEPHLYYIKGVNNYTSATTFIHHFFEDFDSMGIASRMIKRNDFSKNAKYQKYQCLKVDDNGQKVCDAVLIDKIIKSWELNGTVQSGLGTVMHRNIELFYNDEEYIQNTTEFSYFLNFHKTTLEKNWKPLRTEMIVWDHDSRLCGSIDMIYIDTSLNQNLDEWRKGKGVLHIRLVDWKRSKQITMQSYGKYGKTPCHELPDSNFYHYKLQLNLYKFILEKHYNVQVDSMAILVCHPDNDSYNEFVMGDEQELIKEMIDKRIQTLK